MKFLFSKPLLIRGGFFCSLLLFLSGINLDAQFKFREPPNRQDPDALTSKAGERIWELFEWNREIGRFILEGSLTHRPAGSSSQTLQFLMQGNWAGPCHDTVVTLSGNNFALVQKEVEMCEGKVSVMTPGECESTRVVLDSSRMSLPVYDELPFTWNDLLMPYLSWGTPEYIGPDRFLGRPAHRFALTNPDPDSFPERVVVTIDEDYSALLKVEMYDRDGFLGKRMRVDGFKKFGDEWMFSGLTWENRRERASVRLKVYSFKSTNL